MRADSVVVVGTAGWCSIDCCHSGLLIHCQVAKLTQNNAEFDGKNKKARNNCTQWEKKTGFKRRMSEFPSEIDIKYKIFGHIYNVYMFQEADPVSAINH